MYKNSHFEANTLDDLLAHVFGHLVKTTESINATRGKFREILGATLVLYNPRARLSRSETKGKVFTALGELFWYLSKDNNLDFMEYYLPGRYLEESDDGISVRSGYGERLFGHNGHNQIENVISLLRSKPTTRRAVIQLFDASDLSGNFKSIPCTCTLQFIIRNNKLNLLVNMRSNDAYIGLPHDVFAFTMLQEIVARTIDIDVGFYKHFAGSLHLYEDNLDKANIYLEEGWQALIPMESMPLEDPWKAIKVVQGIEARARAMEEVDLSNLELGPYWLDICRLLVIFQKWKIVQNQKDYSLAACQEIVAQISNKNYQMFINGKLDSLKHR